MTKAGTVTRDNPDKQARVVSSRCLAPQRVIRL
jgi:hypothetical protein